MEDTESSAKGLNHSESCEVLHFVENLMKFGLTLWWLTWLNYTYT